ncbi:MAG TPA: tetratricopeptide repeat protein [Candidatus Saccharimonadales bacterium]|nr:tetratricopeptide repeat protein [Candidatus Saccharimonadales bacterium]
MHKTTNWILTLTAATLFVLIGAGCTAKMRANYHLQRADRYFDAGQYEQAEIEYKNVLHDTPKNVQAWGRLGIIYFNQGRSLEAFPILSKAEQLGTTNLDVRLKLGTIYLGVGKLKEARAEADFVLEKNPQDDQALILLAETAATANEVTETSQRLLNLRQKADNASLEMALGTLAFRQRDLNAAESDFKRATALNPKFADAYTALANVYVAQKDFKQADQSFQMASELAPSRPEKGVQYAQFKILTGAADAGRQLLEGIVKKSPDYLPAWLALAQLSAAENDYTNGLTLLDNVLSRDPQNFDGLLLQGRLELLLGNTAEATTDLERMAAAFSQAPSVRYQLAQAYLAGRQTDKAVDSLNQALTLNPNYADAILLLAEIQIRSGNTAPAIVSLTHLIQQQPQIVQARLLLAEAYRAQGALDGAIQIYQGLEQAYPQSAQIPVLLGAAFLQQNQNAAARAEFEKALQLAPDYLPALEQLVNLDLVDKQYAVALQQVQQRVEKNPKTAALQILLGKILAAQGDTNQAEAVLSKAISLQPDDQAAYLLRAQLYDATGQSQKAVADLQTALAKEPKDVAALMLMGGILNSEKDYEGARDAYEKLLALTPNNAVALNNLACVYADHLDQLDQAYSLARQARDAAPTDPSIADTLGWILYRQGQYSSALPLLRESAGKLYAVPEIQFHLGMACYMTGDEADAKTSLQRALQLTGDFPEKDECNQYLAVLNIDVQKAGADTRAWLEKWVASHPDDPVALARLAVICQQEGMTDKAITAYETLLKDNPQNVSAMINLARLYAPTDVQKAYTLAKAAYQLTPNDPEVSHVLGRLAFQTGDYQWAQTLLQLTAQTQPQNPEVLFDLGEAFYSEGKVPQARTAMQNALQTGTPFTRANDAKRFLSMTALADAPAQALASQTQIEDILKSTPNYVPALMVSAAIAVQKGDVAAAEQTYENVLKLYPDFAPAQKQLAILYAEESGNDAEAYPLAVKARAAFPNDPDVAKALGMIVYRQGNYSQAADLLQESARQKNQDPELQYYLGMAEYHLKRGPESKAALQRALDLNLSGKPAAEAKQILAELK